MKTFYGAFCRACVLALLTSLTACGGYSTVSLGGDVIGLTADGLIIENDAQLLVIPANTHAYVFAENIDARHSYSIQVVKQPPGLHCQISGPNGMTTGVAITKADVVCQVNAYAIGGNITGLTGSGLQLVNGPDHMNIAAGKGTFTFSGLVDIGAVYGVAILSQPAGQTCTVKNGTAVMGTQAVNDIEVNCTNN